MTRMTLIVALASMGTAGGASAQGMAPIDDTPSAKSPVCPAGLSATEDTAGHCCWSNQAWAAIRNRCVGIPVCPPGMKARGETCEVKTECDAGKSITSDTAGKCCYPGQVWSVRRTICVGIPACPDGMRVEGEQCVAATRPAGAPDRAAHRSDGLTPVSFEANLERYTYEVRIGEKHCETPCRLYLPPGPAQLIVDGDGAFEKALIIPDRPASMRLQHAAHTELVLGAVLLPISAVMIVAPVGILFSRSGSESLFGLAIASWVIGPILHMTGIVLVGVGSGHLNNTNRLHVWYGEQTSSRASGVPRLTLISAGVTPLPGGGAIGMTFAF